MSAYLQQEYDFITRTQKIIIQYQTVQLKEKFEVTLLLNCFVGLLIIPQQTWFNILPEDLITEDKWGISKNNITYIKKDEITSLKNVARHLRNSISHYRFVAFNNSINQINQIKFEDYDSNKNKTFEAVLPISSLIIFLDKFSNYMLEVMQKEKMI